MRGAAILALVLAAGPGAAQELAPEAALRPFARVIVPPGRPEARAVTPPGTTVAEIAAGVMALRGLVPVGPPVAGEEDRVTPEGAPFAVAAEPVADPALPLLPVRERAAPVAFLPPAPPLRDRTWTPPRHEVAIEALTRVSPETAALGAMIARIAARGPAAPGRPEVRPGTVGPAALPEDGVDVRPEARPYREPPPPPMLDPEEPLLVGQEAAGERRPDFTEQAVALAPRPEDRPEGIERAAEEARVARVRGSVCGDVAIQGVARGDVGGPGACGIEDAVEIRSVAGVRLSTPAVIDCGTAGALRRWVEDVAVPAVGQTGGGIESIRVIGGYTCRSRNNVPGARLSEHSFGRAVDIGGINLRNGNAVTVLNGWGSAAQGAMLRAMHRGACGIFGTVLGPDANAAHRDHFHFDTAQRRSAYCR